jgi:hypothetical protein
MALAEFRLLGAADRSNENRGLMMMVSLMRTDDEDNK